MTAAASMRSDDCRAAMSAMYREEVVGGGAVPAYGPLLSLVSGSTPRRATRTLPCMHFNLVLPKGGSADTQRVATLRDHVVSTAVEMFDGSFSAEHGLGRRNQPYYGKHTPQKLRDLSAAFARHIAPSKLGTVRLG